MRKVPSLLSAILLATGFAHAGEPGWECPIDLKRAALTHRAAMQAKEVEVREARLPALARVEPTEIFDLAAHECHTGRAQMWRLYGEPSCAPASEKGVFAVTYPYGLQYRRALDETALAAQPWKEGSEGLWRVTFELREGEWSPLGQREVLDLSSPNGHGHSKPQIKKEEKR